MKLIKTLWKMCGTEKGSCQILCVLCTIITALNFALDIVPTQFAHTILFLNFLLWVITLRINDD